MVFAGVLARRDKLLYNSASRPSMSSKHGSGKYKVSRPRSRECTRDRYGCYKAITVNQERRHAVTRLRRAEDIHVFASML